MRTIIVWIKKRIPILLTTLIVIAGFSVTILLYNKAQSKTDFSNIVLLIANISTSLVLVATVAYVIISGTQITEMKRQRSHQFQPLPSVRMKYALIKSPDVRMSPFSGEISLEVWINFYNQIKNVGNGVAILVDYFGYFHGNEDKEKNIVFAKRFDMLENGGELFFNYNIRDENHEILKKLNQDYGYDCPAEKLLSYQYKSEIIYKNIEGLSFLVECENIPFVSNTDLGKITNWITQIDIFKSTHISEIALIKSTFARNKEEAHILLKDLSRAFTNECPIDTVTIMFRPISQSYKIMQIDNKEYSLIEAMLNHGMPIGVENNNKQLDAEIKKEVEKIKAIREQRDI